MLCEVPTDNTATMPRAHTQANQQRHVINSGTNTSPRTTTV